MAAEQAGKRDESLPTDLVDLGKLINELDDSIACKSDLRILHSRVIENTRRRRRILNLVQEALSQLRLDMKYLVFDLEATRRERDSFRAQLEGNSDSSEGNDDSLEGNNDASE